MDLLLIGITIIIILGIAYALSRPFTLAESGPERINDLLTPKRQYEVPPKESSALEEQAKTLGMPDAISEPIEEKKAFAADNLQAIHHPEEEKTTNPTETTIDAEETQPEHLFHHDGYGVCPQCGNRVLSSDKFCAHCGHRLQP